MNSLFQVVCTKLEEKHGAGLRNRAVELMEKRIAAEGEPATQAEATLLLDECFGAVKRELLAKKKAEPPGAAVSRKLAQARIKKGSLDDVFTQYKKVLA